MSRAEIISDPQIMLGKLVIAGTRITVEFILEQIATGETSEQIMDGYELTREQVQAALLFAAELACIGIITPLKNFGIMPPKESSAIGSVEQASHPQG